MAEARLYRILGGPGSPYSLKMRAVMRYRRLPYTWTVPTGFPGQADELLAAGKGIIPVIQSPEGEYWADSTPMILELERRYPGTRSLLPRNPADRFLARLIEDFADEWMVLILFDYRWAAEIDQKFCSRRQLASWLGAMPGAEFDSIVDQFTDRQTQLLAKMGDREINRPLLQATYGDTLQAMEEQQDASRFLFGSRPSIADFGVYAQLSQTAIDPSPSAIMRRDAVRTFQWVHDMDDLSGIEGAWRNPTAEPLGPGVLKLLKLIGEVYLPFMAANAKAVRAGDATTTAELRGMPMVARANRYKMRCLTTLKLALRDALAEGAEDLEELLTQYGCWNALQLLPGELDDFAPLSHIDTEPQSGPF